MLWSNGFNSVICPHFNLWKRAICNALGDWKFPPLEDGEIGIEMQLSRMEMTRSKT